MGFGVFSNFRSWGGKKFWMRREGEGAKNFRRIFEIVDILQIYLGKIKGHVKKIFVQI